MVAYKFLTLILLHMLCVPISATPARAPCVEALPYSDLPSPPPGSIARLIVRGIGTQNYSCINAAPVSQGAEALLLDITCLHCSRPRQSGDKRASDEHDVAEVGRHYFTQQLVPVFDFSKAEIPFTFFATKAASVPSPGSPSSGAIDWLYLTPNSAAPNSGGVRAVYRVSTVGGLPEMPCTGSQEVPYMAEYWFFF
jgi:hypothetical protein